MTTDRYDALEQALTAIESGASFDSYLNAHPEIEPDLRQVIETAILAHSDPGDKISDDVLNRSRTRILGKAMQLSTKNKTGWAFLSRIPKLAYVLVLALLLLGSFGGLTIASAQALPGDQFYTIKRAAENFRLNLTTNVKDHQAVEERYERRRVDEIQRLMELGREEFVQFHGRLNKQTGDSWDIDGVTVHLGPQTILFGDITLGMIVEVEGFTHPGGWVQASEIHLQTFSFAGYVESISPDTWQIAGRTVQITPETLIDTEIQVGEWVVVSVQSDDFGTLSARIIDITNLPTPTPTPTNTPTSTPTMPTMETDDEIQEPEDDDPGFGDEDPTGEDDTDDERGGEDNGNDIENDNDDDGEDNDDSEEKDEDGNEGDNDDEDDAKDDDGED